jgi:hypothetical protein
MRDYLNSSYFELRMSFYNLNKQASTPHLSRKKAGANNPFAFPPLRNDRKINLRTVIENAVKRTGTKNLEITDEQYEKLEEVDIYYQVLEVSGYGQLTHCHWSVWDGLSISEIMIDPEHVKEKAIYQSAECFEANAFGSSHEMIEENLSSHKTETTQGTRYVMQAEDYPAEEAQRAYNAYWAKVKESWNTKYVHCFMAPKDENLKNKNVVLATSLRFWGSERRRLLEVLKSQGASAKEKVSKKTEILLVDTKHIEKLDCFAERLWREAEGDIKNASKISKQAIDLALKYNMEGSNICIISLQEYLACVGEDYDRLIAE